MNKEVDIRPYLKKHLEERLAEAVPLYNEEVKLFQENPNPEQIPALQYAQEEIQVLAKCLAKLEV